VPSFDVVIGGYTLVPNPFWGGALLPLVFFAFLYAWPLLERRLTGDHAYHNLLERPRDAPARTAIGMAVLTAVFLVFLAGSADRVDVMFGLPYPPQIWVYRVLVFAGPVVVALLAYRVCVELQRGERVEHEREQAERMARAARGRA
jgi:ubiquinol-cytochrome c reductase cytochrome b subunit